MGNSVKKILKCRKYKMGDKCYDLSMEEKLAIASYNNPNELLNQGSEIFNVCKRKKIGFLVDNHNLFYLIHYSFYTYIYIYIICSFFFI